MPTNKDETKQKILIAYNRNDNIPHLKLCVITV